ncbi:unnamed protein product, partial [Heterosigma akashiwo]
LQSLFEYSPVPSSSRRRYFLIDSNSNEIENDVTMTIWRAICQICTITFLLAPVPSSSFCPPLSFGSQDLTRGAFLHLSGSIASLAMGLGASSASLSSPEKPPQSKDFIRWGIVGLGDVCAQKAGPAFWKCDGAELVAVMRRTPGAAAAWARENVPGDQCTGYDDLKTFLQHPGLDAVYIATPPGAHLAVARQVAAAGLACYVEKPVGRCAAETEEMAKMFAAAGQKLFPAYVSRAHERTVAIRALLAEGVVGDRVTCVRYVLRGTGGARGLGVEEAVLPWRLDAAQSGGGLVMDVGCHVVDRLDYLLGPLTGVTGTAQNRASPRQAVEDYVQLRATVGPCDWAPVTAEGAAVTCTWDFTPAWGEGGGEEEVDELVIEGPGGSLVTAGMGAAAPVSVRDAGEE